MWKEDDTAPKCHFNWGFKERGRRRMAQQWLKDFFHIITRQATMLNHSTHTL